MKNAQEIFAEFFQCPDIVTLLEWEQSIREDQRQKCAEAGIASYPHLGEIKRRILNAGKSPEGEIGR